MYPVLTLFGQKISSFTIMILLGFCVGLIVALLRRKISKLSAIDVFVAMMLAGVGAFFGGKLFFAIQGIPEFLVLHEQTGMSFLTYFIEYAGLVYYGGFIGCILFVVLFCAIYRIRFWQALDSLLPSLPLAQAFGRVGCFLVGCCYGIPFENGCVFSSSILDATPKDIPLLPIQLIESGCVLILFFMMLYYGRKPRKPGKLFSMYLVGYGLIRFVLEFFRYDVHRGIYGGLSVSQWASLIAIALGILLAIFYNTNSRLKH